MQNLDFLNEIDFKNYLDNDTALIAEYCGIDVLTKLWQYLPSANLYISTKPLYKAKKAYIRKYYDGTNIKKLAFKLAVSEKFIVNAINDSGVV